MSGIVWEDPPEAHGPARNRGSYVVFFDGLRARPGEWAVWPGPVSAASMITRIKKGAYMGAESGEFDATTRTQDDGTLKMWVRYIGGES